MDPRRCVFGNEHEGVYDWQIRGEIIGRIVRGVPIPAILISTVGLFVPFVSVLHLSFNIWRIHNACSVLNAALSRGPTTMIIVIPTVFGSVHRTCSAVAVAWPVLIGLGLLGAVAGTVALFRKYGTTKAA